MRKAELLFLASFALIIALWFVDFFNVFPIEIFGLPWAWHFFPEMAGIFFFGWLYSDRGKVFIFGSFVFALTLPIVAVLILFSDIVALPITLFYALLIGVLPISLGYTLPKFW